MSNISTRKSYAKTLSTVSLLLSSSSISQPSKLMYRVRRFSWHHKMRRPWNQCTITWPVTISALSSRLWLIRKKTNWQNSVVNNYTAILFYILINLHVLNPNGALFYRSHFIRHCEGIFNRFAELSSWIHFLMEIVPLRCFVNRNMIRMILVNLGVENLHIRRLIKFLQVFKIRHQEFIFIKVGRFNKLVDWFKF